MKQNQVLNKEAQKETEMQPQVILQPGQADQDVTASTYKPIILRDGITWNPMTDGTKCYLPDCTAPAYHFCDCQLNFFGQRLFRGCGKAFCKDHCYTGGLYYKTVHYSCNDEKCIKSYETLNKRTKYGSYCLKGVIAVLIVAWIIFKLINPDICFLDKNGKEVISSMRSTKRRLRRKSDTKDACETTTVRFSYEKSMVNNLASC